MLRSDINNIFLRNAQGQSQIIIEKMLYHVQSTHMYVCYVHAAHNE